MNNAFIQVKSFARLVNQRRTAGESPYVLVLGAGASLSSGASSTATMVAQVVADHLGLDVTPLPWHERLDHFYRVLDSLSHTERYVVLQQHLMHVVPSSGYRDMAALLRDGYFDVVLSTNFDLLLEDALQGAGVKTGEVAVLINEPHAEQRILQTLDYRTPRIKLWKLHGDLKARVFAFTADEIFQFTTRIEQTLTAMLNRDTVVIGHSLRDDDLNRCIRAEGGALWYVNPMAPTSADYAGRAIHARGTTDRIISGDLGRFDDFWGWLYLYLHLPAPDTVSDIVLRDSLVALNTALLHEDRPAIATTLHGLASYWAAQGRDELAVVCQERGAAVV